MSSTNRSDARNKHIADYYKTPVRSILDFLMEFDNDFQYFFEASKGIILDPCAGGRNAAGICHQTMSYPEALKSFKCVGEVRTIDIRQDSLAELKADYLLTTLDYKPSIIITNPPFNQALPIIKKALVDVADKGIVIMLLRLNFFGSKERFSFFEKTMPLVCYVHQRRMKFTDTSNTDSVEYMHCVWIKNQYPKFAMLRVI